MHRNYENDGYRDDGGHGEAASNIPGFDPKVNDSFWQIIYVERTSGLWRWNRWSPPDGDQLAGNIGAGLATPEKVPAIVLSEHKPGHKQPQESDETSPWASRWCRFGRIAAISAVLAIGMGVFSSSMTSSERVPPRAKELVADDPASLRALGICEADIEMQLKFDLTQKTEMIPQEFSRKISLGQSALTTAKLFSLPCVKSPDLDALVAVRTADNSEEVFVRRADLTTFNYANWPAQRHEIFKEIRTAGEDGNQNTLRQKIIAGNSIYSAYKSNKS